MFAAAARAGNGAAILLIVDGLRLSSYKHAEAVGAVPPERPHGWSDLLQDVLRYIVAYSMHAANAPRRLNVIGAVGDAENTVATIGVVEAPGTAAGVAVDADTLRCRMAARSIMRGDLADVAADAAEGVDVLDVLARLPAVYPSIRRKRTAQAGVPRGNEPMQFMAFFLSCLLSGDYWPTVTSPGFGDVTRASFCEPVAAAAPR